MFIESDPDLVAPTDPTRGFIVDDVIRADETKCPYARFYHCQFNFKNNLALEGHVSTCHREKYTEVRITKKLQISLIIPVKTRNKGVSDEISVGTIGFPTF